MSDESQHLVNEKGLGWRVSLSILVGVGWIVFVILWLSFYREDSWEKNVAIFLLSILVLIGVLGVPWAYWALKKQTSVEKEMWKVKGFRWRVWVSIVIALGVMIFLVYWFWVLAEPYNIYQNLAIFVVSFLIAGGILGAMWAPWSITHGPEHHH
jgi:hypothetical protein